MLLTITTPDKVIYENREIDGFYVQTDDGPMGVLDHHASLITSTANGSLRILAGSETDNYELRNATIRVDNATNSANILAFSCVPTTEVDELDQKNYLEYLEKILSDPTVDKSGLRYKFAQNEKISIERKLK